MNMPVYNRSREIAWNWYTHIYIYFSTVHLHIAQKRWASCKRNASLWSFLQRFFTKSWITWLGTQSRVCLNRKYIIPKYYKKGWIKSLALRLAVFLHQSWVLSFASVSLERSFVSRKSLGSVSTNFMVSSTGPLHFFGKFTLLMPLFTWRHWFNPFTPSPCRWVASKERTFW